MASRSGLTAANLFPRELVNGVRWIVVAAGQVFLAAIGLFGAYFHAFPKVVKDATQNYPVLDITTIAWIGLIVLAALLPKIQEVAFGALSIKLKDATESAEVLRDVSGDLANLVQNWSRSQVIYLSLLSGESSEVARSETTTRFLRDRMGEARQFLGDSQDSNVRIALWIFNDDANELQFIYSPHFTPTKKSYRPGEGFLGQAFLEGRTFSEPDVRLVPSYLRTRATDPPYRAVICIPLKIEEQKIGILTVDKPEAVGFSSIAEEIAAGLASQCCIALEIPTWAS
jgi:GAF domain-containing protein